jgi:hypothetical protein
MALFFFLTIQATVFSPQHIASGAASDATWKFMFMAFKLL